MSACRSTRARWRRCSHCAVSWASAACWPRCWCGAASATRRRRAPSWLRARSTIPARSRASTPPWRAILRHVAERQHDHRPRRLRRRRRVLDGAARAGSARIGRARGLVSARPRERRLRPERGDRASTRRAGHTPAGDGRLRRHRGRGGGACTLAGRRRAGHRSPRAARRRPAAAGADRAPGDLRLPVRRPVRHRRRLQAGAGAVRGGGRRPRGGAPRPRPGRAGNDR